MRARIDEFVDAFLVSQSVTLLKDMAEQQEEKGDIEAVCHVTRQLKFFKGACTPYTCAYTYTVEAAFCFASPRVLFCFLVSCLAPLSQFVCVSC